MLKNKFTSTAYQNLDEFVFGDAKYPVKLKNGMVIGGGTVYPELNFTLPPMSVVDDTIKRAYEHYQEIITGACERARELSVPGFSAEIELVPQMTFRPEWGGQTNKIVVDTIKEHDAKFGVKGAVRLTVTDIREGATLEHMWHGKHWDLVLETFDRAGATGADFLAIETVGGKDVHDEGLMYCDIKKIIFALSVLACRDMEKIWTEIVKIADKYNCTPSGDTACALANTAMVLAEKNYIPRVLGAADRVMNGVRSLVAVECGAKGPDKDCGYEGVYEKAIAGIPITMEGRIAACAHLSSVGNIASCLCDMWSNESTTNIKLLGGMAPTVSFEQLAYDCRIMNLAKKRGKDVALLIRDLNADSDSQLDPHAFILRPDVVLRIAKGIVSVDGWYKRLCKAAELSLAEMAEANKQGRLNLSEKEKVALSQFREDVAAMPSTEDQLLSEMMGECEKLNPKHYDL